MLIRAILLVAFCIVLITPVSALFGPENSCVAVALICILLSVRFVDFGYRVSDSLRNLAIAFALLVAGPAIAARLPMLLAFVVHFLALFGIVRMTSSRPEMGNGGLYAFSYVFLVGNPVEGVLLAKRFALMLVGYLLCAAVFFVKHRAKHTDVHYRTLREQFHLSIRQCQWQLQLALGVSLMLLLGQLLRMERLMWAGFACASLLGCYTEIEGVKERLWERMVGVLLGSALFAVIYQLVPPSLHSTFGPAGGIVLGFCSTYRHKTAMNCLGALLLATSLYGLPGSIFLRIVNNLLGAMFGYGFAYLYQKMMQRHYRCEEGAAA